MYTAEEVAEMLSGVVQRAAEPTVPGELISDRVDRAARRLHIGRSLAKRLWYREIRSIPTHVALSISAYDRFLVGRSGRLAELQAQLDALRRT